MLRFRSKSHIIAGYKAVVDRRLWWLYGLSLIVGVAVVPARLWFGRAAFLLVGCTIVLTVYFLFKLGKDGRTATSALSANLAGLVLGGSLGFWFVGSSSSVLFLGRADPGKMSALAGEWLLNSVLVHLACAFFIWRENRPEPEIDFPRSPEMPENLESLSDEEKLKFKQEMMEYFDVAIPQLEEMQRRNNRQWTIALILIAVGATLIGFVLWKMATW